LNFLKPKKNFQPFDVKKPTCNSCGKFLAADSTVISISSCSRFWQRPTAEQKLPTPSADWNMPSEICSFRRLATRKMRQKSPAPSWVPKWPASLLRTRLYGPAHHFQPSTQILAPKDPTSASGAAVWWNWPDRTIQCKHRGTLCWSDEVNFPNRSTTPCFCARHRCELRKSSPNSCNIWSPIPPDRSMMFRQTQDGIHGYFGSQPTDQTPEETGKIFWRGNWIERKRSEDCCRSWSPCTFCWTGSLIFRHRMPPFFRLGNTNKMNRFPWTNNVH